MGRPQAAEAMIRREGLPDGGVQKRLCGEMSGWRGRSAPIWNCTQVLVRKELVEGGEGLKGGGAVAAAFAAAGGGKDAALKAEDGAGAQVGEHHVLQAEGDVAEWPFATVILVLIVQGTVDFDLVLRAEALFVDEVGGEARRAGGVGGGGDDEFVLRKGFFRDQSAGQIEFSARPVRIGAEGAQVGDDVIDVGG